MRGAVEGRLWMGAHGGEAVEVGCGGAVAGGRGWGCYGGLGGAE